MGSYSSPAPMATLTRPSYQALWPMEIGTHEFTAVGVDGDYPSLGKEPGMVYTDLTADGGAFIR